MQREGAGHAGRNRRNATVFALDSGGVISQAHATARRPRAGITVAQPCIEETYYGLSFAFLPKRTAEIKVARAPVGLLLVFPLLVFLPMFSFSCSTFAFAVLFCPARFLVALSFNVPRLCVPESSFLEGLRGGTAQLALSSTWHVVLGFALEARLRARTPAFPIQLSERSTNASVA